MKAVACGIGVLASAFLLIGSVSAQYVDSGTGVSPVTAAPLSSGTGVSPVTGGSCYGGYTGYVAPQTQAVLLPHTQTVLLPQTHPQTVLAPQAQLLTVQQPIVETQYVPQTVTAYTTQRQTAYRTEAQTVAEPVTRYRTVLADEGRYEQVWVPNIVARQVPETVYEQRTVLRQVPYEVDVQIPTVATQLVPVHTTRVVQQQVIAQTLPSISTYRPLAVLNTTPVYRTTAVACNPCLPTVQAVQLPAVSVPTTTVLLPTLDPIYSGSSVASGTGVPPVSDNRTAQRDPSPYLPQSTDRGTSAADATNEYRPHSHSGTGVPPVTGAALSSGTGVSPVYNTPRPSGTAPSGTGPSGTGVPPVNSAPYVSPDAGFGSGAQSAAPRAVDYDSASTRGSPSAAVVWQSPASTLRR